MEKTFDLEKGDFSYNEFVVCDSVLHDQWISNFSIIGNILTIEFNAFKCFYTYDVETDLYNQYKDYKKCTVTYNVRYINETHTYDNYVDVQSFAFSDIGSRYKGKRIHLTKALDKLNSKPLCLIDTKIGWQGIIVALDEYDIHLNVKEITYNWQ